MKTKLTKGTSFASLFKKYRLRSEIETLSEFGDLLAEEGIIYETSLFTRWQNGERIPKDRKILLTILKIFFENKGMWDYDEANLLLESAGQGYLTDIEKKSFTAHITGEKSFNTALASLGELIKTYRLKKDISQEELSLMLGWQDKRKLNSIEEDLVKRPSRDFIDNFAKILELDGEDKNNLLLAGNYLPSKQDIKEIREQVVPIMEEWPYSAVLYDFCWRIIYINKHHAALLNLGKDILEEMYNSTPCALEIIFDQNFFPNKHLEGEDLKIWHNNLLRFLTHFRTLHKSVIKEQWYINLIQKMMNNNLFRKLWKKALNNEAKIVTSRFGKKVLIDREGNKLYFNIFVVPLKIDPRFELEFYNPSNTVTFSYYESSI